MFEVGWTEMLVIAIVMIVVVGPKDLPNMLRTFGRTTAKLRAMAADFQKQFNEALKEAELDDVKKSVDELRGLSPAAEIRKQLNPFEQAATDVRAGVDAVMKPKPAVDTAAPAASTPQAVEPLKNGAATAAGVSGPEAPIFPAMTDESVVASSASTESAAATSSAKKAKNAPVAKVPADARRQKKASANDAKISAPPKAAKTASASKSPASKSPAAKAQPIAAAKPETTASAKTVAAKTAAKAEPKPAVAKKPASAKKPAGAAK